MKRKLPLITVVICSFILISGTIDLNNLFNYASQNIPNYIDDDNTPNNNPIDDRRATLGRVLFYDKNLSANNTVACASCHHQEFAFGDTATVSVGLDGGLTGRHSMRLVNARFADEDDFFWDERANSLEAQVTQPIQDHIEMGFSGQDGAPDFDDLLEKLEGIDYYQELFTFAYGSPTINGVRISRALANFVRSIQSFDSKYDIGRAQVNNDGNPFPNFTQQENRGKALFRGQADCNQCHSDPEFDITQNSDNNGVIGVANDPEGIDLTNTKAPTLRDLVNPQGVLNGPMMHDGSMKTLMDVLDHYNVIEFDPEINPDLDQRLRDRRGGGGGGGGQNDQGQNLELDQQDKEDIIAFLHTLTGSDVYTNEKWSNPFNEDGNLTLISFCETDDVVLDISICEGDIYEGETEAGTYTNTYQNVEGCDSIVTLHLTVHPIAETDIVAEICPGEEFEGYTEEGLYMDVFVSSITGCDSIRNLGLFILPSDDSSCLVNTEDLEEKYHFQMGPNPFVDYLSLEADFEMETSIVIYNLAGQELMRQLMPAGLQTTQLSTETLATGVYVVTAMDTATGQAYLSKKVVKM